MTFGGTMWYVVFLVLFCTSVTVLGIQVHEEVLDDPSTTVALPLQVSNRQNENFAENSTTPSTAKEHIQFSSHFTHHIHIPDTNSQSSIKQFVPSPQLNMWNEKVTLSPEHNHFQPLSYGPQYKVLHAKVTPVSFRNTAALMPNNGGRGHFIWVPYASETTTIRNTELPPTVRNPWRWTLDTENGNSNIVGDITPDRGTISFADNFNIWRDIKKKPFKDLPYPYEISETPFTSAWTTERIPSETTTLEMEELPQKSKFNHLNTLSANKESPWKKLAHILTAAIPIGLLISALTPHVVYVNPNNTLQSTINPSLSLYPGRLRSLDSGGSHNIPNFIGDERKMKNPLMDFITMFSEANNDVGVNCENRVFCELSRMGAYSDSDVLQKMLWKIANETSDMIAKKTGLITLFKAIRENKCTIFQCNMHTTTLSLQNADNE
ncbi:uncharacterized protein LOC129797579 isoform X2 [Lutzomyia longipalpis]|uniref:uncharacterized protein LOC129797579 isoform X2 n=1 Tax=Lutzomyia longipalpis TaxID=7200 RepID=UPI002483443A|nr:uncharacterized protein LOC129797579 isoform X2 [Lutzomyia longipalpis]